MANEGVGPNDPRYGTRGNSDNHGNPHNTGS